MQSKIGDFYRAIVRPLVASVTMGCVGIFNNELAQVLPRRLCIGSYCPMQRLSLPGCIQPPSRGQEWAKGYSQLFAASA
jgi:hypothetical protein